MEKRNTMKSTTHRQKMPLKSNRFSFIRLAQLLLIARHAISKKIVLVLIISCTCTDMMAQIKVTFTMPLAPSPANPVFRQYVSAGAGSSTLNFLPSFDPPVRIFGQLKCLSPKPFVIELKPSYMATDTFSPPPNSRTLGFKEISEAFGNFVPGNLDFQDITQSEVVDANNEIRLPDGVYTICLYAKEYFGNCPNSNGCIVSSVTCSNTFTIGCRPINGAQVNTTVKTPFNPLVAQAISNNQVTSTIQFNSPPGCSQQAQVKMFGRIERLSPSPFTISIDPNYQQQSPVLINPSPTQLNATQQLEAFANLNPSNLILSGIDLASITDATNNIRLPDGNYRICYYARYLNSNNTLGENASNPNQGCGNFTIECNPINGVQINTNVPGPVNPFIAQTIQAGGINSRVQLNSQQFCGPQTAVKIFGKIERISPAPFTILLDPNKYQQQTPVLLNSGQTQLTPNQQLDAFANFNQSNLTVSGIDLQSIKDPANNIKLPDGNYRICYFARYVNRNGNLGGEASNANLGCGNFNICKGASAPQFIQPVNNFSVTSLISLITPTSPVAFTWTPPQSTCGVPPGGYQYDFEIREIMPSQGPVDAINNPFVFRRTSLPTTTFLLDTNLYKNVLQRGKRYIIRVRATDLVTNSSTDIENDGFSRVEAFQYGENMEITTKTQRGRIDPLLSYLLFDERKTDFWDDQFTSFQSGGRPDTLVPIKEFIAYHLMQNGTAYSLDAIELFYLLNPDLINEKEVKLSHKANAPVLPIVRSTVRQKLDATHAKNLTPDQKEGDSFRVNLDSLISLNSRLTMPENTSAIIGTLINQLESSVKDIGTADRVSQNITNALLSELIFDLRAYAINPKTADLNHIKDVVNDLQELKSVTTDNAAYSPPEQLLPQTYAATSAVYRYDEQPVQISFTKNIVINAYEDFLFASMDKILPFDVIVYRSKTPPAGPVLNAPDLTATYRVLYTLSSLYNNKNPEVNASSVPDLASTSQVSLPQTLGYKFWTLNMLNHKRTSATTVDIKDVFQNSRKRWPNPKKLSIVLKVD
jgi:hypothetical protein